MNLKSFVLMNSIFRNGFDLQNLFILNKLDSILKNA